MYMYVDQMGDGDCATKVDQTIDGVKLYGWKLQSWPGRVPCSNSCYSCNNNNTLSLVVIPVAQITLHISIYMYLQLFSTHTRCNILDRRRSCGKNVNMYAYKSICYKQNLGLLNNTYDILEGEVIIYSTGCGC